MTEKKLTTEQAINLLKTIALCHPLSRIQEAFEMAIEALSELKTGHWILKPMLPNIHRYECSVCNSHHRARYDFCPSCGSRMFEENGDEE